MLIENEVLCRIAKLAKLSFADSQLDQFIGQFEKILQLAESLKSLDCDGVEPLTSPDDLPLRLRVDEVADGNLQEQLFMNAPKAQASLAKAVKCFIVPKVIE
jgi:aspartyl-tRNA(Asn)/glutamyl-tRNA(Gln) amidotransferase subunit C